MDKDIREITKRLLHTEFESLSPVEQKVIQSFTQHLHVSKNVHQEREGQLTFVQRLVDKVAFFGGLLANETPCCKQQGVSLTF